VTAPTRSSRTGPNTPFGVCFDLFVRSQATRARLASLLTLGAVGVVIGVAIGSSDPVDAAESGADFVAGFGLTLFVPITTLVFASAVFGDLREDGSMVYLWLRPVSPRLVVLAGYLSTVTVVLPVVVVPLMIAAACTGGGAGVIAATAASASLAVLAYGALFLCLGLRVQRALVWGLAYILLWEGFVAEFGVTPARMAIRTYAGSLLAAVSDTEWRGTTTVSTAAAALVPLAVVLIALAYASRRFRRQDVA
jgi:ABC-2 type transport system permease protein